MSPILKFTHNKLSWALVFLHILYIVLSLKLSKPYNKTINSRNTWDEVVLKFHYDLRSSGTQTEYRLHRSTKIYMYIL